MAGITNETGSFVFRLSPEVGKYRVNRKTRRRPARQPGHGNRRRRRLSGRAFAAAEKLNSLPTENLFRNLFFRFRRRLCFPRLVPGLC